MNTQTPRPQNVIAAFVRLVSVQHGFELGD